jgi:predicted transposase YdaD
MLHLPIDDVKKTRFYQEVFSEGLGEGWEEGRDEALRSLIELPLIRRHGALTLEQRAAIQTLSSRDLSTLGEALLDFRTIADLDHWLQQR